LIEAYDVVAAVMLPTSASGLDNLGRIAGSVAYPEAGYVSLISKLQLDGKHFGGRIPFFSTSHRPERHNVVVPIR